MLANDLSGRVSLDTTDFKTAISTLNREVRVIESGFRAASVGLGDWSKSASGLELRIEALTKKIDLQKQKVAALEGEYKRVREEKGENSIAAKNLEIRLNRERETLGKLENELVDTDKALENVGDETEKTGKKIEKTENKIKNFSSSLKSKLGTALKGIALGVAGLVAAFAGLAVGIGAGIKKAVGAASDLNEAVNATNVVFGDNADTIHEWGKTAADTAGLSQRAFEQMAAQTGAMLKNFGLDVDTAADETINLAQRAADMASIFNTDVDDALTAIQAGLRGEADPLERFGVSLSAARVKAKALELGLEDADGQLSQSALTQARLALLFEQTNDIAGDFVNTSDQMANASRVQKARWENFMASIGTRFLPIVERFQGIFMDVAEQVMPLVEKALDNVMPAIERIAGFIGDLIAVIADAGVGSIEFYEVLEDIFGSKITGIIKTVINFGENIGKAFSEIRELITGIFGGGIEDAVGSFANIFYYLAEAFGLSDEMAEKVFSAAEKIGETIQNLIGEVGGTITTIVDIFGDFFDGILSGEDAVGDFANLFYDLAEAFGATKKQATKIFEVIRTIGDSIVKFWNQAKPILEKVAGIIVDIVRPAFEKLVEGVKNAFSNLQPLFDSFRGLWEALGPAILALLGLLGGAIAVVLGVVVGLFSGIAQAIQPFIETIVSVVTNIVTIITGIVQVITSILQTIWGLITGNEELLLEAEQNFMDGMMNIWTGIKDGIIDLVTGLVDTVIALVSGFVDGIVKFFTGLWEALVGGSIVVDIVEGIKRLFQDGIDFVLNIINTWVVAIKKIFQDFMDVLHSTIDAGLNLIKDIWETAWNGIRDFITNAIDGIVKAAQNIIDNILGIFTDTDWLQLGIDLVQGIADGISAGAKWAVDAIMRLASALWDSLTGFFKLGSPSKLMLDFGQQRGVDLAQGFLKSIPELKRTINLALNSLPGSGSAPGGLAPQTVSTRQAVHIFGGLNLSGVENSKSLLRELTELMA